MGIQEEQPLLQPSNQYQTIQTHQEQEPLGPSEPSAPFPDSLPGATYRETLNWPSAYILVVSRVIGSGIFATPGSIVKSAGSIGLTLLIWLIGTILSACGLAVSMEFGCMLPRSGGEKVTRHLCTDAEGVLAKLVDILLGVPRIYLSATAVSCL